MIGDTGTRGGALMLDNGDGWHSGFVVVSIGNDRWHWRDRRCAAGR